MDQRQRRERNDHKMLISDSVAKLIEELLREGGGQVEVRRSDLADRVGCAPSQINYVITSRFTPPPRLDSMRYPRSGVNLEVMT